MINEIRKKKTEGAAAEVGVFRRMFSKMINAKFLEKQSYLFDTFESFGADEFQQELE